MLSDLQLVLEYKTPSLRGCFHTIAFMKWLFVIIIPALIMIALLSSMIVPAWRPFLFNEWSEILCFSLSLVLIAGAVWLLDSILFRTTLKLSKEGITLPTGFGTTAQMQFHYGWSDINSASLVSADDAKADGSILVLTTTTGSPIRLNMNGFAPNEREQLLLAVELWGTNLIRSPELVEYQLQLQNEAKGLASLSYTSLWEEELSRRFRATTFVPMEPGRKLQRGHLTVLKQLAFGGWSAIYLVQRDGASLYVLKESVVPANTDLDRRREAEKHLARESQILYFLSHPNIAKVVDYFVEESRTYLLMEYVCGQDLRQLVQQNGPQSLDKVIDWCKQLTEALQFLHALEPPVIHRDVTPDNIVLRNDGTVILIDFGAANEFLGTATGTIVGKHAYMAPEQVRGKTRCESDIYSLGATLFYLLTGRDPKPLSVSHPRELLNSIPPSVDLLIASMTALEYKNRLGDIAELKSELSKIESMIDADANASVA